MSDKEINWNSELGGYEMCTTCLDSAMDAAYSSGFLTEDDEFVIIEDDGSEENPEYSALSKDEDYD